jgi:hypothetical protein
MLIVKGVNFFPKQVEPALLGIPGVGSNYQILVEEAESRSVYRRICGTRSIQLFYRVDPSVSSKYDGIGLGLAISNKPAERMGRRTWVRSCHGVCSCFYFTLKTISGSYQHGPGDYPEGSWQVVELGGKNGAREGARCSDGRDVTVGRRVIAMVIQDVGQAFSWSPDQGLYSL